MNDTGSVQNPHGDAKTGLKPLLKSMLGILEFHYKKNISKDNIETHLHDL